MKRILLALAVFCLFPLTLGTMSRQTVQAMPQTIDYGGFALPFSGTYNISQGPDCNVTGTHVGRSEEAIDFAMTEKTPIYASASGVVVMAGSDSSGFGNLIKIKHSNDDVSWYAHLYSFASGVVVGSSVNQNQLIGYSGDTGNSTNPHLHFEIRGSDNISFRIVTLPGLHWYSNDINNTCYGGNYDGTGTSPAQVILYPNQNLSGGIKDFLFHLGDTNTYRLDQNAFDNAAQSIYIKTSHSVKFSETPFGVTNKCLNAGSYSDLSNLYYDGTNTSLDSTISSLQIFDVPDCNQPPVCLPAVMSFDTVSALSNTCAGPTPIPTPIVTSTPLPPVGGSWNVKVFTAVDECKDNPNCNPSSQVLNTTLYGSSINQNFGDGKAFGTGYTTWGAILTQRINFTPGNYFLHLNHDDGAKVWLNGQSVMDLWENSDPQTTCPSKYLSGPTDISVVWKNTGGGANLNFYFDTDGTACQAQSSQWNVKWYSDPNICTAAECNPPQVYCEQNIQGGWFHIYYPQDGRACNGGNDRWGSIWKGTFNFPDGNYVFHSDHDDGVKIFVGNANGGNAIMDVGGTENDNRACPGIHLSGDVPVTVIHKNEGGHARISVWWDTNTTVCDPPPATNVWISKDTSDQTHVILENGNASTASLYLARNGQDMEITKTLWFTVSNGIEAIIPDDVDAFLVNQGYVPTVGDSIAGEWSNFASDPHWVIRKKLTVSLDEFGQTKLNYYGDHTQPLLLYYDLTGQEQSISTLWTEKSDGSGIEAVIPSDAISFKLERWLRPRLEESANTWWQEENYWLNKRQIMVNLDSNDQVKVNYYRGTPLPVSLGRYGQDLETRTDLWQTETVDGHTNYFFMIPSDVIAFQIQGGPIPQVDTWATWSWSNYETSHWVSQNTTWVYKNASNETQVLYTNKNINPEDVNIIYYLMGENIEHSTTSWWSKTASGLLMTIPRNVESFNIARGPAPVITDQSSVEWYPVSTDGRWLVRKPIRIWIDSWGKTYVTYWHEQITRPKIHYVLNNQEFVTTELWALVGDGIQARIPDDVTHFLIEVNNEPYLEDSAYPVWKFTSLPDLWLELIPSITPSPTPTITPTETATSNPSTIVKVRARSTTADTKMSLSIGTTYTKIITVGSVAKTYSFVVPFKIDSSHKIRLSLINGSSNIRHPIRKLEVISINFNGVTRYAKTLVRSNVFSVGAKKGTNSCYSLTLPVQLISSRATDWLYCKGYFEFR